MPNELWVKIIGLLGIVVIAYYAFTSGILPEKKQLTVAENLPEHTVEVSSLEPRKGGRVQVRVKAFISDEDCSALIEAYRDRGAPDGQVGVNMPSNIEALNGAIVPRCLENFDGKGIVFNQELFD